MSDNRVPHEGLQLTTASWCRTHLSDAVVINPTHSLRIGVSAPYLAMDAIRPWQRSVGRPALRSYMGSGSKFQNGDTLLARITPCLENGKTAYIDCLRDGEVAYGSTEFIVLAGKPGLSDGRFVYYVARNPAVRDFAIANMQGTSGRQRVPVDALTKLEIDLPPLPEQRAIAAVLGALDDKIELNRRMNKTLEEMAQALFRSWFVDFDPVRAKMEGRQPVGMDAATAALFPAAMEPSEVGEIPAGWTVAPLDSIATFLNGLALQKYPQADERYLPAIKIAEMRSGVTASSDHVSADVDNAYIVSDGDVLFSWSGSLECVQWSGGKGALNQHLFKVTSGAFPKWFYFHWILHHLPDFRHIAAGKATTMGHIQRHHLTQALVVIPSLEALRAADAILGPTIEASLQSSLEINLIANLRDTMLPELMSGVLRC